MNRLPAITLLTAFATLATTCVSPARAELRGAARAEAFTAIEAASQSAAAPVVLFDNAHAETAGNADWTVTGAYSDFADTLRHHGYSVQSHDHGPIDAQSLTGVAVLVLPEPNHRLAAGEIAAITAFVKAGGGLFAIGDHWGSDRDNDGWDSPKIFNELTPAMGITFDQNKFNEAPIGAKFAAGPLGTGVKAMGAWGADSLTLSNGARAELTYGPKNGSLPFIASNAFGSGRVVAMGDSSPFDDGTGTPGKHLYPEYNNASYGMAQFALNATNWLAGKAQEPADLAQ